MANPFYSFVATGLFASAALAAQDGTAFPLSLDGQHAPTGVTMLRPSLAEIGALAGQDEVLLTDVPTARGELVDLQLTRIRHELLEFGYMVDGVPAPNLQEGLNLSVWKGSVAGDSGSEVLLSFSNFGTRGWISTGGELNHFMPQPDDAGSWTNGYTLLASERDLGRLGAEANFTCHADELVNLDRVELDGIPAGSTGPITVGGSGLLYGCEIAIETDWQLNQVFGGNLAAETAYMTTLWTAVSDRYVEQVNTVLSFPYMMFWTTSNDGWSTPDSGGSTSAMLDEFLQAWQGNIPAGAAIGHFVSGASLGGGIAYLSVLCDDQDDFSFAVSANIDGNTPFPIAVGPLNWDFMVTAHETGHNFGSPHTHDFSPQIDNCAGGSCITNGTIMSYCHLCPGGLSNITTFFHPSVVNTINAHVSSCLDLVVGIIALPPSIVPPGVPTSLTANIEGSPVGAVELNYRLDSGSSFTAIPMSAIGGGDYTADLPAPGCEDEPEFFFSFTDALAGPIQSDVYSASVGDLTVIFQDDFESFTGWSVGAAGDDATTGIWVRGDPNGTAAQPSTGVAIGSGTDCYFTGQGSPGGSVGEEDIDGGKTTLVSPVFDLSSGDATIGYWRWYSNDAGASPGADIFEVQVTNNGSSWFDVEVVGPTGPETQGGWFYNQFDVSSIVSPTANVQIRFIASDEGDGSVVEAAVDEVSVFRVNCGETCQPDLGFGGPGTATLSMCGDVLTSSGTAELKIENGPASSSAWIGYSSSFNPTPLLGGTLVPIPIVDVLALTTDGSGNATLVVPGGAASPVTLYLQGVILDGGSGEFLITNALGADFLP
ncbi:MAG: M12 family metallo-peptidase [Planctomycetota bacterium]